MKRELYWPLKISHRVWKYTASASTVERGYSSAVRSCVSTGGHEESTDGNSTVANEYIIQQ